MTSERSERVRAMLRGWLKTCKDPKSCFLMTPKDVRDILAELELAAPAPVAAQEGAEREWPDAPGVWSRNGMLFLAAQNNLDEIFVIGQQTPQWLRVSSTDAERLRLHGHWMPCEVHVPSPVADSGERTTSYKTPLALIQLNVTDQDRVVIKCGNIEVVANGIATLSEQCGMLMQEVQRLQWIINQVDQRLGGKFVMDVAEQTQRTFERIPVDDRESAAAAERGGGE